MSQMKQAMSLTLIVAGWVANVPAVFAQTSPQPTSKPSLPPERPVNRKGGGDRGVCEGWQAAPSQALTALVPATGEARSAAETPTLWFYIPYSSPEPLSARFSLQDERGREVLIESSTIALSKIPGMIQIRLPAGLELEKSYRWYLTLMCDPQKDGPVVDGWIRRVSTQPTDLWLDRLTLLSVQRDRASQPEWEALLREEGLEALSQVPIVPCCPLKPIPN